MERDEELLAFIGEHQWTRPQIADHVAHALTVAEKLFVPDEYSRANKYASGLAARYHSSQEGSRRDSERTQEPHELSTPMQNASPSTNHAAQGYPASVTPAENTAGAEEPKQPIQQRYGFGVNEFIVYPAHGVGQILAIEEQEIAGANLELFVINFIKDKMTLRVPTRKIANIGMRKLSDPAVVQQVHRTLSQPPHIAEGNWSRRAQEYQSKINSGDIVAIAEVMRDLYWPAVDAGQSYSERQLYAAALDRLAREVAVVQHITEEEAVTELESLVIARRWV